MHRGIDPSGPGAGFGAAAPALAPVLYTHKLQGLALGCMHLARLMSDHAGYDRWERHYMGLCLVYSEKRVLRKLEELDRRGYVDYGVSPRGSWLTEKGWQVLAAQAV